MRADRPTLVLALLLALTACTTSGDLEAPGGFGDAGDAGGDASTARDAGRDASDAAVDDAARDSALPGDAALDAPTPTDGGGDAMPPGDATTDSAAAGDASADAGDAAAPPDAGDAGAPADAATTDAATADAAADGAVTDAAPLDAGADAPAPDASACPGTAGPPAIRVGAFCIDSTEVTNADYAAFLASAPPAQPPPCAWNTSFVPGAWPPGPGQEAYPVGAVDWCDAYAFCAWAGKRLCGAIAGGATPFSSYADPATSQWMSACSAGGAHAFPYGDTYDPSACNGKDFPDGGALRPGASLASCQGGTPGVFDMSGNVYEWEDACQGDGGASDLCHYRGGGYFTPGPPASGNLACAGGATLSRDPGAAFLDVGFRCCSP